jgi:hypothetical protein
VFTADFSSGEWMQETEALIKDKFPDAQFPDPVVGIFNIYSDSTSVTASMSQSAHPVYISVGYFCNEVRGKDGAWRAVALIPELRASEAVRALPEFGAFKTTLFHQCLAFFFEPMVEMVKAGGFLLSINGRVERVIPQISVFTQDSMEVFLLCDWLALSKIRRARCCVD